MAATILDPYATLGIPAQASRDEAGRAHRRLAKQFHPDVNPGPAAAARMRRINDAWRILSDPARRSQYDAGHGARSMAGSWAGSRSASGYGPRAGTATWAPWPEDRVTSPARARRPERAEPVEPSFGDRPVVLVAVWVVLGLLYVIGAWLGSISP